MSDDSIAQDVGSQMMVVDTTGSQAETDLSSDAYNSLLAVLTRESCTIKNGIIVVRAIEKVIDCWNKLLVGDNFNIDDYVDFTMEVVDPLDKQDGHDFYYLTAKAIIAPFENRAAEVTVKSLGLIETGVVAFRRTIDDALGYEGTTNGKFDAIAAVRAKQVEWEMERDMDQPENDNGLQLSFPSHKLDILAEAASLRPRIPIARQQPATNRGGGVAGRGNRNATGHVGAQWTDTEKLEVRKIWNDHPYATLEWKTDEFNSRFPANPPRSGHGIRFQQRKMVDAGITVASLQASLGITPTASGSGTQAAAAGQDDEENDEDWAEVGR